MKGGERAGRGEEELKKVSKSWTPKGRAVRVGRGKKGLGYTRQPGAKERARSSFNLSSKSL